MKSLVSATNTTELDIECGNVVFEPDTPKVIFRNVELFGTPVYVGEFTDYIVSGDLVGNDFDGEALDVEDAIAITNRILGEISACGNLESYSFEFHWRKLSCERLSDGLKHQIDLFDWDGESVTLNLWESLGRSAIADVLCYLNIGYLDVAADGLDALTPDTDDDFFSAARIAQFSAMFSAALTTVEE